MSRARVQPRQNGCETDNRVQSGNRLRKTSRGNATTDQTSNECTSASDNSKLGHLAENTLRLAMHGLGYPVTVHGFRSLLTDLLAERDFNVEATERQLDHTLGHLQSDKESNPVRRHYLRTDFLDYRRTMMQWVADWCDARKAGKKEPALPGDVIQLRAA